MSLLHHIWKFLSVGICCLLLIPSCHKIRVDENSPVQFSTNQVTFDTVFTTVGSVTQNFRIYNPYNSEIKVDVDLAGGQHSAYSINVDGVAGYSFQDVLIPPKDSIFVHVKVNINPNDQNTPFLVTDSVIVRHGSSVQDVDLVAFGQNAHFIVADQGSGSLRYKIIAREHETVHWTNDLPYVVYGGFAAVDSLGTLIIDPGTTVYFHSGAGLWVYRYGNIQAVGTQEQPITFRGDKLSSWYETDYAQWDRIWINEGTVDNRLEHVEISNAFIGLQVESLSEVLSGRTILKQCTIHNTQNSGLLARAVNITAENCQISNNGSCGLQLSIGNYDFKHLTVANYFSQSGRKNPAVYVSNFYSDNVYNYVGHTASSFTNCIIYGMLEDEVAVAKTSDNDVQMQAVFENCLVRSSTQYEGFDNCIRNQDPMFESNSGQNYHLKAGSPAIDAGKSGTGVLTDITGASRDSHPDIGAFEAVAR
ncbi:MAG: hypothetical protein J5642_07145 [Bacteroidales bacterium]|nr:hypothetical protein [Bacteroidales bacterium]